MENAITADYRRLYEELLDKCAEQALLIATLKGQASEAGTRRQPLSNWAYDQFTYLQLKNRSLEAKLGGFRTGEQYRSMKAEHKAQLAAKDREIGRLKTELAASQRQATNLRHEWWQTFEDAQGEHAKELEKKERRIQELQARAFKAEGLCDELRGRLTEKGRELYAALTDLEEEREKVQRFRAQINRDHENSSVPSSQKPNRKKIANNREKTGRKPGGQPGHKGHPRKKHAPTNTIEIPAPEEYIGNPAYRQTGRTVTKQMVDIRVELVVTEYVTPEFIHVPTGHRTHAEFPDGVDDDVNYGGSVKSFAFLLNNFCNVSVAKVSDFLAELTGGRLRVSTGMISGLSSSFSLKTQAEQKKAFADILLSPVMNTDFTTVRVNGRKVNVLVCATPEIALYFPRERKGHEGVIDTPVQTYLGAMVHDHDITFYSYGGAHQECLEHPSRYLKGSMENEPALKWNARMRDLVREMMHFRKTLDPDDERDPDEIDPGQVAEFEARYDEILILAKSEYEYEPPTKYNRDGFNLHKKMSAYRDNHLLFLHDRRIPYTNNLAERLLRVLKRKLSQAMTFRSDDGLKHLCDTLGMLASLRARDENLYESVASIFCRPADTGISS
jgi:hypothetical protein